MIHALFLAMLVTGAAEHRPHPRPKAPAPKAAPKPPPPPLEEDLEDPPDPPEDEPEPARDPLDDDDLFKPRGRAQDQLTQDQLQAIGGAAICTCFCFVAGLVALVIFLVRRSNKPAAGAAPPPPPPAAGPRPIPFHLSVFAVGMHASARQLVAQQLILSGAQPDPVDAAERAKLVRELAKAVRGFESEWTHFGYGERLDLADDAAAQRSYQLAVEDFGRRSADPSSSGDGTYVVMTLVMCTRRQLRGVSALDDRAQVRALLDDRAALAEADLMGAYVAWSGGLGGHEVLTRFPEMHAVR